jgi:hypothetical protein
MIKQPVSQRPKKIVIKVIVKKKKVKGFQSLFNHHPQTGELSLLEPTSVQDPEGAKIVDKSPPPTPTRRRRLKLNLQLDGESFYSCYF